MKLRHHLLTHEELPYTIIVSVPAFHNPLLGMGSGWSVVTSSPLFFNIELSRKEHDMSKHSLLSELMYFDYVEENFVNGPKDDSKDNGSEEVRVE